MPLSSARGFALASMLFLLSALLVVTATLFFRLFLDGQAASNVSAGSDALYVAEAGVQHLWSILEPAPDFAREAAWADGSPPFPSPNGFPEPPRTYRVRVSVTDDGGLRAISEGTSHRGARRRVEAYFAREPFRPPALLAAAAGLGAADVAGSIDLDCDDPGEPPLGGETAEAARLLGLAARGSSAVVTGSTGLAEAATRLAPYADRTLDGDQAAGAWGSGDAPQVTRLVGGAAIGGQVTAVGVVIAEGPLEIHGRLEIDGLLLAPGGIHVDGELVVRGALWLDRELRVDASGGLALACSASAVGRAETAGHGLLPKAATLRAWREAW